MHFDVHDKRIIIKSRPPMENEFVMYKSVLIQDDFIKHLLNYVSDNSDLAWEWIDPKEFANRDMRGFRIFKHAKCVTRDL